MIDLAFKLIQIGIILNIVFLLFVTIALFTIVFTLKAQNTYEYNRIISYSKTLGKVSNWQSVANMVIPFYGFSIYCRALKILLIEDHLFPYFRFKYMETEIDKLRIFKRKT
jgi:hypothetical protein